MSKFSSSARPCAATPAPRSQVIARTLPDTVLKSRTATTLLFASAAAYCMAHAAWGQGLTLPDLPPAPDARRTAAAPPPASAPTAPAATAPATTTPATTAPATTTPADPVSADTTKAVAPAKGGIAINIDGRIVEADPAPLLVRGAILVPLRGVLEKMGAQVDYDARDGRIDVTGNGRRASLRVGQRNAIVDVRTVLLSAAPQSYGGTTYVPLRSLAEIFGYRVNWFPALQTVAIYTREGVVKNSANHREVLGAAGRFGINIDFQGATPEEVDRLLDAAKAAGAGLIRTRFDWNTLEPTKGAAFQWATYDRIVREARTRGLVVTGVLGDAAHWASVYSKTNDDFLKTYGPPRDTEMAAWSNYVRRTVGRYANDVHQWQIWDRASSNTFRSGQRVYFQMLALATEAARKSDPKAILLAGEPGGVDLGWTELLGSLPVSKSVDGVASYPASGWQPGRPARPEEFSLPYATLRARLGARGKSALPVGGLSFPVLSKVGDQVPGTTNADDDRIARLLATYTPGAQADYLMRSAVLAYTQNAPQIFWNALRDDAGYEQIEPVNPDFGSGLLQRDFTPRPSYAAYRTLVNQLTGRTFIGAVAAGPDVVALVFEKDIEADIALWSPTGKGKVLLSSQAGVTAPADVLRIVTRADSVVLDSTGRQIGTAEGALQIGTRPVWITQAAASTMQAARANGPRLKLVSPPDAWTEAFGARAEFANDAASGGEQGISWRKYLDFRAAATTFSTGPDNTGLVTETARNPLRPGDGRFFIFLDVDDDYMFFERGAPVEVTVTVHRVTPEVGALVKHEGGFNIEYDSANGVKNTEWQVIEEGTGWSTYTYRLPDASFANRGGYDLLINTFGSKRDLVFGSVTIKKLDKTALAASPAPAAATPAAGVAAPAANPGTTSASVSSALATPASAPAVTPPPAAS